MEETAFLVMVNVPDEDWSFKIEEQRKIIGRSSEAAIRIPARNEQVSRRHAVTWCDNRGIWLTDLGSRGGTFVNGIALEKRRPTKIALGDRIALRDIELKVVPKVSKLAEVLVETGVVLPTPETDASATEIDSTQYTSFVQLMLRQLTPAELDILLWMYRGYTSDEELGRTLHRSPNTVRTQVSSIFEKLNLHSRTEIVSWLKRTTNASRPARKPASRTRER